MNCRTCFYNSCEPVMASDDPAEGVMNHCNQPDVLADMAGGPHEPEVAHAISEWMREIEWDAECLCPEVTTPCPGFEPRS